MVATYNQYSYKITFNSNVEFELNLTLDQNIWGKKIVSWKANQFIWSKCRSLFKINSYVLNLYSGQSIRG
jgi:hypothetical protein